jgi:hypothetical protein
MPGGRLKRTGGLIEDTPLIRVNFDGSPVFIAHIDNDLVIQVRYTNEYCFNITIEQRPASEHTDCLL